MSINCNYYWKFFVALFAILSYQATLTSAYQSTGIARFARLSKFSFDTNDASNQATNKLFKYNLNVKPLYAGPGDAAGLDDKTKEKIDTLLDTHKVVLFMKGNKLFPQCGFSNTAVRILDALATPYETVNVLEDEKMRNGIKIYSAWPTIPQLYINKEFIGGSDIMIQMYQNGELAEMIELANAN